MQQEILPLTNQSRITSALPALSFKGRVEEKGKIIQYLLRDSAGESEIQRSQNVHCLPLVAMGGMGKTALAQQVFDHFENVKKEHFHIKIWVCVSTDFNASSLMKKILEYSTRQSESGPMELIPVKLKEKLHSKRFLLVLDDAWDDDNRAEWEKLCAPLLYGQNGSWILLTTRSRSVAKMVSKVIRGTMEPMKLPGLSEDECRSLLYEHAFAGENPNEFPLLKKISEEIVEKLDGVPLLAKSIGGALNSKLTVDHWMRISRSEVWKMPHDSKSEFIPALTLSYVMLPPQLKRCFSYCGIFPEDYQFNKQNLVGMWVAAGLIYSDGSEEGSDEDIASRYFDMLCNKSFFDVHTINYSSLSFYDTGRGYFRCGVPPWLFLRDKPNILLHKERDYYTMHDMLNGLARHVSRYECCRIVHGAPCSILDYNAIRHIFISSPNTDAQLQDAQLHDLAKKVCKLKHVRTLWIQFYNGDSEKLDDFIRDACGSPRRIRVLIIKSGQCLESIGDFVKLRFLDISAHRQPRHPLSRRPWQSLSKSISSFYFLQVLIGNEDIPILAKDANKLTNLRHLYEVDEDALLSVAEVGKLTSLQELCFSVGTESGHRIDELMNMNDLHQLKIEQLSNVRSLEEANKASLVKKRNLTRLELHYQDGKYCWEKVSRNPDLDQQEVLAALRPPLTIRELFITHYKGGRPAPWMDTSSLSWLESLELYGCPCFEELPSLWKLPCLKFLKLDLLVAIKSLGCHSSDQMDMQFPVLEKLQFSNLPLWEEWNGADDYIWFPHLKGFEIDYCRKLKKIPDLPLSIEYLKMEKLGLEALPRFYKYSNGSRTFGGLLQLTSLESLEIDAYLIIGEDNNNLLPSSLKKLILKGFLGRPKFLSVEVESQKLLEDKTRKHAVSSSSVFDHSASNKAALPSSLVSLKLQESDIWQKSLGRCLQGLTSLQELRVFRWDHLLSSLVACWNPSVTRAKPPPARMVASASSLRAAAATPTQVSVATFAASPSSHRCLAAPSIPLPSKPTKPLLFAAKGLGFRRHLPIIANAKLNEVVGGSAYDATSSETKTEMSASKGKNEKDEKLSPPSAPLLSDNTIAEFMSQVSNLVKLVDSRDIAELQLKQNSCELIIRKKEALPQSQPAQVVMMPTPAPVSSAFPQAPPVPALPSPSPASSGPPAPASTPKDLKTSGSPLKSPMAGTFYRSPGPGLPPFVKPGDKVNKGQVLCIIEAMKLMNEIEADQAGTIVEILVEEGKPVGVGQPIFVIEP